MKAADRLTGTAILFLALGDKTRLRLLNLMRDREVCVSSFTTVLGQSQPKISRHLAYLRNAGVVEVRRDGKWMHYRVASDLDADRQNLLFELFRWMEDQEALSHDRKKFEREIGGAPEPPAKARSGRRHARPARMRDPRNDAKPASPPEAAPVDYRDDDSRASQYIEPDIRPVHHNELEDFLL